MNISKSTLIIVLLVAVLLAFNACSNSKSPIESALNDGQIISQDIPDSIGEQCDNRTILAGYNAVINPATKEFTLTPADRNSEYHFNLTSIYPDVLEVTNYGWTPNFWADIKLAHPVPGSCIDVFDPRVIAILPANPGVGMNYPIFNVYANNSVILEPDGYTKLFDSVSPSIIGNTNPFIAYFKDQPYRQWSSVQPLEDTERWQMDIDGFGGSFEFCLVVDISTNYPQLSYPYTDNASEPVQMQIEIANGLFPEGGSARVTATLLDWQGHSDVKCKVESPDLFNQAVELFYTGPGQNPHEYIFSGWISNSNLAAIGKYNLLISAWDISSDVHVFSEETVRVSGGNLVWANSAGGRGYDEGFGITALPDKSTVVIGSYHNGAIFGEGEKNETVLNTVQGFDIFIARYNPDGTLAWVKCAKGNGNDFGSAITRLPDDSVVATGHYIYSTTFGVGEPNETVLTSSGSFDIFIARYNPDGTLRWAKSAGAAGSCVNDTGDAITSLPDESTIITGTIKGTAIFGKDESNETTLLCDEYDIFIARYNPDGTLDWAKRAGGPDNDTGLGITSLSDYSTVVTGRFKESAIFGEGELNQTVLISDSPTDYVTFIARYNPDGTLVWAKKAGSAEWNEQDAITSLSGNSFVVTGSFFNTAIFGEGEINQTILTSAGLYDIFIARYRPDGTLEWAKRAGGTSGECSNGITTLKDNSTVMTGRLNSTAIFGLGELNETILTTAYSDVFIARYNPDGTLAWAKNTGEGDYSVASGGAITSISDDSTAVTGWFNGSPVFGPGELNETVLASHGYRDIFIARFMP